MNVSVRLTANADVVDELRAIVGDEDVLTSLQERTFYSTDISGEGEVAAAVVRVDTVDTLVRVVEACASRGVGVVPRGGGFSYTGGYTPTTPGSVIVDLRPMDRVVEINAEDMYVVVETGCTWAKLYETLKAEGLRTPYFGPMSGFNATIGGALSQGSFFLGSTGNGMVSDSVLGLEVVLVDGTVVKTGSWASNEGASPFLRQYGPDLTGLFLSDTGAMGLKTRAVLKLIPFPSNQTYATFAFQTHAAAMQALSAIGRTGLAAECYTWDPYFVRLMAAASGGARQDLGYLWNVVKSGSGLLDGLFAGLQMAMAGRSAFKGDTWLLHLVIDDVSSAGARAKLLRLRALAKAAGGRETPPSAPRTLRGTPFTNFNTTDRQSALRNLPTNSLTPHSGAGALADDIYAFLAAHKAEMEAHGIACGVIFFAVGAQAVCIEPLIYWSDERHRLHDRVRQFSDLNAIAAFPAEPEATTVARRLREGVKAIMRSHRCAHVQIGRTYPWAQTRSPATLRLLTGFKAMVDPEGLMNRGSLGFEGPTS